VTRLRLLGRIVGDAIRGTGSRIASTVRSVTDQELIAVVGLVLMGWGLHVQPWDFGFAVPGAVLVAIALGFSFATLVELRSGK